MAISQQVTDDIGGAAGVFYGELFRGQSEIENFTWVQPDGSAQNLTGWDIKAQMEFYTANVPAGGGAATDKTQEGLNKDTIDLVVNIPTQTGDNLGIFSVLIPDNAWIDEFDIDLTDNVPTGMMFIRIKDKKDNPTVDEFVRVQYTFRYAPLFT